jgi:hypothetical protein
MFIIIIITIIYAAAVVEIIRENRMLESVPRTHWLGKQECFCIILNETVLEIKCYL